MAINFKRLENISKALKPVHQNGRSFHVSFVYNKKKLVCIANNDYNKQHPYHRFGKYKSKYDDRQNEYVPGVHAECSALIKMGLEDCSHLTMVNIRVDNNNKPAISKPCSNCEALLRQVGIKKVWYFDGVEYICEKY